MITVLNTRAISSRIRPMITSNSEFLFSVCFTMLVCHQVAKKQNALSKYSFVKSENPKREKDVMEWHHSFPHFPIPHIPKSPSPYPCIDVVISDKTRLNTYHTTTIQVHTSVAHLKTKTLAPKTKTRTIIVPSFFRSHSFS